MASEKEMIINLVERYKSLLKDIEMFDKLFPDSKAEYNYWVDRAADLLDTSKILGLTGFPPIPAKK